MIKVLVVLGAPFALLALAILLPSCGDGGEESEPAPTTSALPVDPPPPPPKK